MPDAAARLQRHPALASLRTGRTRGRTVRTVWHDTAQGTLASHGLALAEIPGRTPLWRLLRSLPEAQDPVRPGLPPRVEAEAATPGALDLGVSDPLVPLVAFDGRRADTPLADGLHLSLLAGELRAVAAREPVARLTIAGDAAAAHALAMRLAADLPLLPAAVTLAEQGRALAQGTPCRPRRIGAPHLPTGLDVGGALAFVVGHLAEVMLAWLPAARAGETPEGVHQMRVALRRLRSALKIFGKTLGCDAIADLDDRLKTLAQALGPARDWDVFLAGAGADLSALIPEKPVLALIADARSQRAAAYRELAQVLAGPAFRQTMIAAAALAATRPWPEEPAAEPAEAFARRMLARRHKRMLAHGKDIASWPDEELHALRLDGKRLRYAAEFFAPLFPGKDAKRFVRRLAALQETLGIVNDGAVAAGLIGGIARTGRRAFASGALRGLVAGRAAAARGEAVEAWERFRERKPFWT